MEFNFNDNSVVESIDKVPQDFRGLYVEGDDGKFKLDTTDPKVKSAVSAITGLNKALVASRAEARDAKGKVIDLSALSEFGDTPDAILEGVNTKIDEIKKASKGKGAEDLERQVTKIKEELAKSHAVELEKAVKRGDALQGQLYTLLVQNEATMALAEAKAIDPDLARPFIEKQVKVTEENGKFEVHVIDEAGDPRYSGTTGTYMSIKELVAEMKAKEKFAPLFKSETQSGGGGDPHKASGGVRRGGEQQGDKSSIDKISSGLEKRRRG